MKPSTMWLLLGAGTLGAVYYFASQAKAAEPQPKPQPLPPSGVQDTILNETYKGYAYKLDQAPDGTWTVSMTYQGKPYSYGPFRAAGSYTALEVARSAAQGAIDVLTNTPHIQT